MSERDDALLARRLELVRRARAERQRLRTVEEGRAAVERRMRLALRGILAVCRQPLRAEDGSAWVLLDKCAVLAACGLGPAEALDENPHA